MSESKIEEIIATLWTIVWAILWASHAPFWLLVFLGCKVVGDHLCVFYYALKEINKESKDP